MKRTVLALAAIALSLMSTPTLASNQLILLSEDDFRNEASVAIEGNENRLEIVQEHNGGGSANQLNATITGDLNGGPMGSSFSSPVARLGLEPGRLVQTGFGNLMNVNVEGTSNLFAFVQAGSHNSISATMRGTGNQAAVSQVGVGNLANFSQNGVGNMISISQTSW